jgi:hypothetical protein
MNEIKTIEGEFINEVEVREIQPGKYCNRIDVHFLTDDNLTLELKYTEEDKVVDIERITISPDHAAELSKVFAMHLGNVIAKRIKKEEVVDNKNENK